MSLSSFSFSFLTFFSERDFGSPLIVWWMCLKNWYTSQNVYPEKVSELVAWELILRLLRM